MPVVTRIPATRHQFTEMPLVSNKKRKVAGYARVSTDHEEQQSSYENQVAYYTRYINERNDWKFVGMYSDEGITATNTRNREGFKKMVEDALAGKIDLIITKSVSRFARNTVDSLVTVRKLKEAGVEVYFEKENIWTLDSKGELLITIMSSLAQEESRNISENTTWGQRKRFEEGKATVPFSRFLGYVRGPNGEMIVEPKQAKLVRRIYRMYLRGESVNGIKRILESEKIPSPGGKKKWSKTTIRHILTNEKYKGDALLQKTFTVDFLTKKKKVNEGEVPQYYVEGEHEAIVSPGIFQMVQNEMQRRRNSKGCCYSSATFLASRIRCAECGGWYGSKVWHSTDKYRKTVYQCNHKFKNGCKTPFVEEKQVQRWFIEAANKIYEKRDEILSNLGAALAALDNEEDLKSKIKALETSLEDKRVEVDRARDVDEHDRLVREYEKEKEVLDDLADKLGENQARKHVLEMFINTIREHDSVIEEFDEELWISLVDTLEIHSKEDIRFILKDGEEIKMTMS